MFVVIEGDRISAVAAIAAPIDESWFANADVVDASGKFLIPGLWDMHVHWYEKDYLPLFIANGVTGIRIMWGMPMHHAWRKEIERDFLLGPRLFIASAVIDGPNPIWPGSVVASNESEGREAVKMAKSQQADCVKVYSLLSRDAYFAIADEAKKERIPFVGHVPMSITAREASMAAQMSIEHLDGILNACSTREDELLKSAKQALAENRATSNRSTLMAEWRHEYYVAMGSYSSDKARELCATFKQNHTWQCPTLTVLRTIMSLGSLTNDIRLKYIPVDVRSDWMNAGTSKKKSAERQAFGQRLFKKYLELTGAMQHAGVDLIAGTDTGNPFCFLGFGLHDELELLVQAGFTPMEALQAATRNPARFMGREQDLGTVEKGKLADLVLLDANPLDDITNTRRINAVVYHGKLYSRGALDRMLHKIEVLASGGASAMK